MQDQIAEIATNPKTVVAVSTSMSVANIIGLYVPPFIQVMSAIYIVVMVAHKGWSWYQEYLDRKAKKSVEDADT